MSIKPIQRIKQFIQNNEIARQNAAKALENLQELYGDKVEYYSIYNSKNGTVSALGFKKGCTPYSCAYSIFPNGDEMQKIAEYKFTNDGLKKYYLSLLKTKEGKCTLVSTVVDEGSIAKSKKAEFQISKKEPQTIDLTAHLKTMPMPKRD